MSVDGLPPSLQISNSKSQFLSPKFQPFPSENNFPFIGKFPEMLKPYSDAVNQSTMASLNSDHNWRVAKSEHDFVPSEHDFLQDKMSQSCRKIVARC